MKISFYQIQFETSPICCQSFGLILMKLHEATDILSNSFFSTLSKRHLEKLIPHVTLVNLQPKEILFHEGDFADAFYIVKEGALRITTVDSDGNIIFLARIGKNGFFGEQAFSIASSPRRRATATAQLETVLYKFPREELLLLQREAQGFQDELRNKDAYYLKEKLNKLIEHIQNSSYKLEELFEQKQFYPQRSVIYFHGDEAHYAYILVSGEIELRHYNQEKQVDKIVTIGPGQLFGSEAITDEIKTYDFTAIAKQDVNCFLIPGLQFNKTLQTHPVLKELCANFKAQFAFKSKGKVLQFRSEYLEMPAITSIISFGNKEEVVCNHIIGDPIFVASIATVTPSHKIMYRRELFYREISLLKNKIVGLLEYGLWEDSHYFLDAIIEGVDISKEQINQFSTTGKITIPLFEQQSSEQELICKCMRVSQGVINQLISQKCDFAEISRQTGAGTICGGCKPTILEMLGSKAWGSCVISRVIDHNPDIKSFQLKPLMEKIIPFNTGQYLVVKAKINNAWVQRNYTLTSTPDKPYYEITVKREAKGLFSRWLFEHEKDNIILYIAGPYGEFTLESAHNNPIICFMGGIGITPAVAFARYLTTHSKQQCIYIDYSANSSEQFILMDEFSKMTQKHPDVVIHSRVTSKEGILTEEEIRDIISSNTNCHIYVCGPKGLEKLVIETVKKMNLSPERLHVEQFIHAGAPENLPQSI